MHTVYKSNKPQRRKSTARALLGLVIGASGVIVFPSHGHWPLAIAFGLIFLFSYWRLDAARSDKTHIELNNETLKLRLKRDMVYAALFDTRRIVSDHQNSPYRNEREFDLSEILAVAWDPEVDTSGSSGFQAIPRFTIRTKDECYTITNGTLEGEDRSLLDDILPVLERYKTQIMPVIRPDGHNRTNIENKTQRNLRNHSIARTIVHLALGGTVILFLSAPLWSSQSAFIAYTLVVMGGFLALIWLIGVLLTRVMAKNHTEIGYVQDGRIVIAGNHQSYSLSPEDILHAKFRLQSQGPSYVQIELSDGTCTRVFENFTDDLAGKIREESDAAWSKIAARRQRMIQRRSPQSPSQ